MRRGRTRSGVRSARLARRAGNQRALVLASGIRVRAEPLRFARRGRRTGAHAVGEARRRHVSPLQRFEHARVQPRAGHGSDRLLDGAADQLVTEGHRRARADQDVVRDAVLDRVGLRARDLAQQGERHVRPDHRRGVLRAASRRREAPRARQRRVADARREAAAGGDRFHHQQRLPARQAHQLARVERRRLRQLADGFVRERSRAQALRARASDQVADEEPQVLVPPSSSSR